MNTDEHFVGLLRMRAERAVLRRLDCGTGVIYPRHLSQLTVRNNKTRKRLHSGSIRSEDTHSEALAELDRAIESLEQTADALPPRLLEFAERCALSPAELAIVSTALAVALDVDTQVLLSSLNEGRPLSGHILLEVFSEFDASQILNALHSSSVLRTNEYLESSQSLPGLTEPLVLASSLLHWLIGDDRLPAELAEISELCSSQDNDDFGVASALGTASVQLVGQAGAGKFAAVQGAAYRLQCPLIRTDLVRLTDAQTQIPRLIAQAEMRGALLYIAGYDASGVEDVRETLNRCLPRTRTKIVMGCRQNTALRVAVPIRSLTLASPDRASRTQAWSEVLAQYSVEDHASLASDLGRRYVLGPSDVHEICHLAASEADGAPDGRGLERVLSRALALNLGSFARRITRLATWEELVLEEDADQSLRQMATMVRERNTIFEEWGFARHLGLSRGVSALFSGPPGTGKTMAASVLASELGLDLFRIDVSQVMSKWVGETEKHLARIFDEAHSSNAMLLFDEADSLFGKRSEVNNASDRYANLEINYILQRMEEFDGISILTTNLENAMDEALMRRLSFRIRFDAPDENARLELWRRLLPPETGLSDHELLTELADKFEMSGGHIRNAIVRAAVIAATHDRKLTAADLRAGAVAEYVELGKVTPLS